MLTLSRPNFFPGQYFDYRDFNRLSQQADKVNSLLCRYLFAGGGIVVDALDGLAVTPLKGLSALVHPGLCLLPSGQPAVMDKKTVVDLSQYAPTKGTKTIVVGLRNKVEGKDRFVDKEDPSISGYLTEVYEPEVVLSAKKVPAETIELFRVVLGAETKSLRPLNVGEEWTSDLNPSEEGLIDLRYRKLIVPQTFEACDTNDVIDLRKSLYSIQDSHRKLKKIFLIEDPHQTGQYIAQLHSELLSRPFQPLKLSFLASEFATALSLFLETLDHRSGTNRSNLDRKRLHQVVELLDNLKTKEVLPKEIQFPLINKAAKTLNALVQYSEEKFGLLNTIEESLIDIRDRLIGFDDKLSLAGHMFQKVDVITSADQHRWSIKAAQVHERNVSTNFENGDPLALDGLFFRKGVLSINLEVPDPTKPLIALAHQYIRRAGSVVHYEMNGKHIATDDWSSLKLRNRWMNKGLIIPKTQLSAQNNTLRIRIEKTDLDFGFFDFSFYQPIVDKGDSK